MVLLGEPRGHGLPHRLEYVKHKCLEIINLQESPLSLSFYLFYAVCSLNSLLSVLPQLGVELVFYIG